VGEKAGDTRELARHGGEGKEKEMSYRAINPKK
jgi:hypothetical protein